MIAHMKCNQLSNSIVLQTIYMALDINVMDNSVTLVARMLAIEDKGDTALVCSLFCNRKHFNPYTSVAS